MFEYLKKKKTNLLKSVDIYVNIYYSILFRIKRCSRNIEMRVFFLPPNASLSLF